MSLQNLPRHILSGILDLVLSREYFNISDGLSLMLTSRHLNTETSYALFDRDALKFHNAVFDGHCEKPTGVALEKLVRGFLLRPLTNIHSLYPVWRSLRDGALILMVLRSSQAEAVVSKRIIAVATSSSASPTEEQSVKGLIVPTTFHEERTSDDDGDEIFSEDALKSICKAFIDVLGEHKAFYSLDPIWSRNSIDTQMFNDKPGHFWAFLAASYDGGLELLKKVMDACKAQFKNDEDLLVLKTIFAAGLFAMAKQGHYDAAQALLNQPEARINFRFQNIRFPVTNAMEAAISANQCEIVELFLSNGWDLTTVPLDYIRALRATIIDMKESPLRVRLLQVLLEGSCQQWRSEVIITGMYQSLFERGDIETCKLIIRLLEQSDQARYQWQWSIDDDATNDKVMAPPMPNNNEDDDDDDFPDIEDFVSSDRKTALYQAVKNDHHHMIPFLLENEKLFPSSMSANFTLSAKVVCLEHAIEKGKTEMLNALTPFMAPVDSRLLFVFATFHGNISAMSTLLMRVDLNEVIPDHSVFWSFSCFSSELGEALNPMLDHINPNNFLFSTYGGSTRNVRLGTFALLIAIKALQVSAAKFLLERGCQIGARLLFLTLNVRDFNHARVFLPHDAANCEDCTPFAPRIGKWMLMLGLTHFTYIDLKRMIEQGASFPTRRTRCFTKRNWWSLWKWTPAMTLEDMQAKIITAIQVPKQIFLGISDSDEAARRFREMHGLMRKWKMPQIYIYDPDD